MSSGHLSPVLAWIDTRSNRLDGQQLQIQLQRQAKSDKRLSSSQTSALLASRDETPATTTLEPDTRLTSSTSLGEDNSDDGLCSIRPVARRSLVPGSRFKPADIAERALVCSRIDEDNYHDMVKSIYKRTKLNIQQIHITESGSMVVFSAIDLICDRFNCSKLTVFNVSGQEIHDSSVLAKWLANWPQLEVLDLTNTSVKSIESFLLADDGPPVLLKNLIHLQLDFNQITELDFNFILERSPNLRHLSLVNNSIYNISCNENLRSRVRTQFETISLAGNHINCEKNQLWFMRQLINPMANNKFPDYEKINCSSPSNLIEMTWAQRVSVLETRICYDCSCKSLKRTAILVECHNKNLTALPDILPLNTKILNLTSNRIDSLGVPQKSENWENVTYVHLEDNLISSIQPFESNNKLLRNLAALDIRRNKFQTFPSHIFDQLVNLDQVHLSDNPWLCDCESTFKFQEWLQRQFHKVGDKEEIRCGVAGLEENGLRSNNQQQRLSHRVIYRLSKSELCPQDNEANFDWLDVVNCLLGVTIILILLKVVMDYIYQHRTKRLPHFFRLNC